VLDNKKKIIMEEEAEKAKRIHESIKKGDKPQEEAENALMEDREEDVIF
jgi:hypothetical protein